MKKALFIRLDKIGDLISTMPVDQVEYLRDWEITWVIAKGMAFIPEHAIPKRKYLELDKNDPVESRRKLETLVKELKPDVAVSFQTPWWMNFILWKYGVKKRIGVLSKWDSFLFLNEGLRQRRSQAIQHEADYNLELVRQIAPGKILEAEAPILELQAEPQPALLELHHLTPKNYMVVHPGMAGSALNWPTEYYIELIGELVKEYQVVLTGTPADEPWLKDIKEKFREHPQVLNLQNKLDAKQLLYVLEQANSVFAPSTGVIHMAASLGTRTYGFYSPIRVQTEKRWRPRSTRAATHVFTPPGTGLEQDCMKKVTPAQVLKAIR